MASWAELMTRVARDIGPQPHYRARTRKGAHILYTHEQAIALAGDAKRQRVGKGRHQGGGKKPEVYNPDKQKGTCTKLEDAVVDPEREKEPKSHGKEEDDETKQNKYVKFMCLLCKDHNRRFNHPPDKCNYAKGGIWHGLEGAALKEAKQAFFDKRKAARKERNAKKRKSRKAIRRETVPGADQPARWSWKSPLSSCDVRKVVSASVRKKGRGRKHPKGSEEACAPGAARSHRQRCNNNAEAGRNQRTSGGSSGGNNGSHQEHDTSGCSAHVSTTNATTRSCCRHGKLT